LKSFHKNRDTRELCLASELYSWSEASRPVVVGMRAIQEASGVRRNALADDATLAQLLKDMQRDSVELNGRLYRGWADEDGAELGLNSSSGAFAGPGVCSIVFALAEEIRSLSDSVEVSEAEALVLAHQVLCACNRTQSGGATLDAANLLCGHDDFGIIVADAERPPPLKLTVFCPSPHSVTSGSSQMLEPGSGASASSASRATDASEAAMSSLLLKLPATPLVDKPGNASGTKQVQKRLKHRKTSSEGDFSFASLGREEALSMDSSTLRPEHHSGSGKLGTDGIWSKMRHRRRGSEPLSSDQLPSAEELEFDEFSALDPGPRVEVEVTMPYRICNPSFSEESRAVLARVSAKFSRAFALVGPRKAVALGDGHVTLSLLPPARCTDACG